MMKMSKRILAVLLALLLPLLRGSSSGCRGKKKNNYTLL